MLEFGLLDRGMLYASDRGMLYVLPALALLALLVLALHSLHAYGFGVKQNPYFPPASSSMETQLTNLSNKLL